MNRSEHSSSQVWWSKVASVVSSQCSRHMSGSSPALRARSAAEVVSRLVTSSDSTNPRNSAWPMFLDLARARRSGRVSRHRPSFDLAQHALELVETVGTGRHAKPPAVVASAARSVPSPDSGSTDLAGEMRKSSSGPDEASGEQRALDGRLFDAGLGGTLEHAADERDAVGLGVSRLATGFVHSGRSPLLHEAEQRVALAHLGPRQRMVEQHRRVGADSGPVRPAAMD